MIAKLGRGKILRFVNDQTAWSDSIPLRFSNSIVLLLEVKPDTNTYNYSDKISHKVTSVTVSLTIQQVLLEAERILTREGLVQRKVYRAVKFKCGMLDNK